MELRTAFQPRREVTPLRRKRFSILMRENWEDWWWLIYFIFLKMIQFLLCYDKINF